MITRIQESASPATLQRLPRRGSLTQGGRGGVSGRQGGWCLGPDALNMSHYVIGTSPALIFPGRSQQQWSCMYEKPFLELQSHINSL